MARDALLFDLDGTLADTHRWCAEALAGACTTTVDVIHSQITSRKPAIILAERLGVGRSRFLSACRAALPRLPLYPGAREALQQLHDRGRPLGLVTSQSPAVVRVIMEEPLLRKCFSSVVAAERGLRPKPAPDALLKALKQINVPPSRRVWYVGDHRNDQLTADAAGVRFAWASFGYR
jgi:AHBA synthesis associated protein